MAVFNLLQEENMFEENMARHVIKINTNRKTSYLRLPVQLWPSPKYPGLHIHTYDP